MSNGQIKNIVYPRLPALSWAPDEQEASLQKVVDFACERAEKAIDWYLYKKANKRWWAQALRAGAIVLTIVGAAIPALAEIGKGLYEISASWAYLALVLAGGLISLDKFFGYSSAWMRFLTTEMAIQGKLSEFLWDWEMRRARWQGQPPDFDQVTSSLERCGTFVTEVLNILKDEMDIWVGEFHAALKDVEAAAKAQRQAAHAQAKGSKPGALNIVVENGDKCDGPWSVLVDDEHVGKFQGTHAALTGLTPGLRKLVVTGEINGKEIEASKVLEITGDSITNDQITLTV